MTLRGKKRHHSYLNGSTPDEAYFKGEILPKSAYRLNYIEAKENRIATNKKNVCDPCK